MKVSVVVPVYNAEAFLARCVDSILGQTLSDIEVVLVNDGSTDASGAIIDAYAARDARVKAIHTENRGPAEAQHTGILASGGRYVTVYDNDDYAPLDALERLYERAEETGADLVIGDYWQSRTIGLSDFVRIHQSAFDEETDPIRAVGRWLNEEFDRGTLWATLMRRELYLSAVREYPLNYFAQDFVALVQLFFNAKKIVRLNYPVYNYVRRQESVSHRWQWDSKGSDEFLTITRWMLDYLDQIPEKAAFANETAYCALVRTGIWLLKNHEAGLGSDLSDLKARIFRDYYSNRTARRRMCREWPKQFVFLAAERRAGWRLVRNVLWGTPWMSKTVRTIRKTWQKIK